MSAPEVDVVDVTSGVVPMDEPTSYEGNMNTTSQPAFDDMPYLSSHPSGWSFEGDEEELLQSQGIQRPMAQTQNVDDEEEMSKAFDVLDDDTDIFNTLQMFTETKKGLGWK